MKLSPEEIKFIEAFAKSCRRSILEMVSNAQSGHPGGSLSMIDFLSVLYCMRVAESNEPVIVSNGHVSPAVYAVLAELGVVDKERALKNFRRANDIFEGHVNRKIDGIFYGTGPLGIGASVASAMALAEKMKKSGKSVFLTMGDGEQQEGQAYEMMNFASKYKLGNLLMFIDYNQVQLSDSLSEIMPINIKGHYEAAGWQVLEIDGHSLEEIWDAINSAERDRPTLILGKTVMGKGVEFMEKVGLENKADWHGKSPSKEDASKALSEIELNDEEQKILAEGLKKLNIKIDSKQIESGKINTGKSIIYPADKLTDCRSAYGAALLDLAKLNPQILAMTADLSESVKTDGVKRNFPERHIECGIAEQHMISAAGGLSLRGFVPFASTFGAFMTSRAKDQARVNDINETNVKMVATHCGLSVGEDGPTHQVIDDINSFEGFMNTKILEPCDPNQTDKIIRAIASEYGNFYLRMGRAKCPVITDEHGSEFFGENYEFKIGKADVLRSGKRATIVASGPMVSRAIEAAKEMGGDIEVIAVSSLLPFDNDTIVKSAKKTGRVITIQDHNIRTGLAKFTKEALFDAGLNVKFKAMGVSEYQLSGTSDELYEKAGLGIKDIVACLKEII